MLQSQNERISYKKEAAIELPNTLESFKGKSDTDSYPDQIFIHANTFFDDEEWEGFLEAAKGKSKIVGVRIRDNSAFKV